MSMTLKEIEREALLLSENDRLHLIDRLSESLEDPGSEIEKSWAVESERRLDELLDGRVKGIPAEETLSRLEAKLFERYRTSSAG